MAQDSLSVGNGTGAAVRAAINTAMQASATNQSGSSAPSTTYPFQLFANTSNSTLQIRNAANNAYINVSDTGQIGAANLGLLPASGGTISGNLIVSGNLTVNGSTTTIDTTTLTVEDKNIEIGKVASPSDTTADGGGLTLLGATNKTFNWVDSTDSWTSSEHIDLASGKVIKSAGTQILSATNFTGTSAIATNVTVADESSDTSCNVLFTTAATGNLPPKTGTNLTFNSSSGALTATSFVGDLNGNIPDDSVTSAKIVDGAILNVDINASAAIARTKLANVDVVDDTSPQLGGNLDVNTKNILFGDSGSASDDRLVFGAGTDLSIYHDGSHSRMVNGTGELFINSSLTKINNAANNAPLAHFTQGGSVDLYYDGSKKFETTSIGATVTGHLTTTGEIFAGDDINLPDNKKISLGTGADLKIRHDGNNSIIEDTGTGALKIATSQLQVTNAAVDENLLRATQDGAVEIYYDNSKKLETSAGGVSITGELNVTTKVAYPDNGKAIFGTGDDLQIFHDGSNSFIKDTGTGALAISGSQISFDSSDSSEYMIKAVENAQVELYFNGSKKFETITEGIHVTGDVSITGDYLADDNEKLKMGDGFDLQIYHDGSNSFVKNSTGGLDLNSDLIHLRNGANNETYARFTANGAAELYFDNSLKFTTLANGWGIASGIEANIPNIDLHFMDSWKASFGSGRDLQIYHNGTDSYVQNNTGNLFIMANASDVGIQVISDNAVKLRYNDVTKIETTSSGASVTGYLDVTNSGGLTAQIYHSSSGDTVGCVMRHGRGGLSGFSGKMISFRGNDGTEEGSVVIGTTATAFNTSSDYRLKENQVAISDGIARLKQLKPYRFNFKKDTDTTVDGFFAHEVTSAVPEAIYGAKDATNSDGSIKPQQIDQSKLVPLLTAALQESITKIETLETKVAALEAA